ncbi:hypothetical protein MM1S1540310_4204 [Mycobacteroides abscessus subsp. bolletii 1S-154-0310]|uniref:Uncharacterized protein n=1 Tax=Mycobacteroides abscessus 1948 TaxID=1299323 RepID=A0A829QKB5_9MYCO|nr:hypothetical protein MA6G0125S_4787 [Mycobacteroides abscessus 6G-0125-S]EIU39984.1 hypothetical protein MA6G0125R_3746 [Mycobacteroides abscessus 6G-0125-R]EIU52243.1 hypothetical protein MA6G1108_4715 [Mycobacteroides abscessus 6G-1108]EIU54248.1 hypothetical protein MA6G0728S_4477 [Mycobacteroides abscessus 6G-0728-S]EIU57967.1 hypothetical protein MM1S1510930_4650 [Mycobacteroides abscessus subsp. bolletii 1S-151-0930]EIU70357.1 hypothetical protein MM1S1520914_4857 [Mycobacteroides abs
MNRRGATPFRTSGGWVVVPAGAMSQFHVRPTIAEQVG